MPAFDVPSPWQTVLADVLATSKSHSLASFISDQESQGLNIYPPKADRFRALTLTSPSQVRVVILGQDPYHGLGQANGLAFSVALGMKTPPSLRNIYKELQRDLAIPTPNHGCLDQWAKQGVLLLNTVLTVEEGKPGSHQALGWELITDAIITHLGQRQTPTVFMLWGAFAQKKRALIQGSQHVVLVSAHPSPLSAHHGFFECGHFSKANAFLKEAKINWAIKTSL